MDRRKFLAGTAVAGGWLVHERAATAGENAAQKSSAPRLVAPAKGKIPVAFAISEGATVIDFCGPWEVFQDVHVHSRGTTMDEMMPFQLFTVADKPDPVRVTGGMQIVPDYTVANAPQPRVIVVPAMRASEPLLAWLRKASAEADLTMSVCTGAFVLAKAGLLKGRAATTHHDFFDRFAAQHPDVELRRGLRFVEGDARTATAGGLTSGIDLALRVVERYFGREVAQTTATYMEYQSTGWIA
jgi:transcriptional regulator GlxA family with amidase domain